ncbi:response regulator transcription factor [Vibrio lentus]|uniref:response regulator transcription factor n=1 Tax=Vibrio lentus TaxID=136468 RepID=UPI00178CFF10|nr:response regulator transcription factor [Vibrio lentus]MDN3628613.1 response regulator transcription factor [Vibrio lentus]
MKILVIDDKAKETDHPRSNLLKVLEEREGITYDLIMPDATQLKRKLAKSETGEYDLIIVDYMFDKPTSLFKTGTSLYSVIRSYTENTPIYLISVKRSPTNQIGDFELFIGNKFLENHTACKADIESHTALKMCRSVEGFLRLIQCPEDIKEDIEILIKPTLSKSDLGEVVNGDHIPPRELNNSLNLRLFSWLARSLLRKEGPLVSSSGAAALLGVSLEYFERISGEFNDALYKGIFNQSFDKRWWSISLEDNIYTRNDPEKYLENRPFKEAAAKLLHAKEDDLSSCAVCDQHYPDSLGIVAGEAQHELHPVHVTCSLFDDTLPKEPFFRNPRIIEIS